MISPDTYYDPMENPSDGHRRRMWKAIKGEIGRKDRRRMLIIEWKSFVYGAAASVALLFAGVGVYATLSRLIDSSRPQSVRLETTYESAIRQFERFVPAAAPADPETKNLISRGKEQLEYLDGAIEQMRKEVNGTDISPLKRARLRQLYSAKLEVLQELAEQGRTEL